MTFLNTCRKTYTFLKDNYECIPLIIPIAGGVFYSFYITYYIAKNDPWVRFGGKIAHHIPNWEEGVEYAVPIDLEKLTAGIHKDPNYWKNMKALNDSQAEL